MSSTHPTENCDVLEIPSELRLKIYGYVFDDIPPRIYPFAYYVPPRPSVAILQVCRQTRNEALPILNDIFKQVTIDLNCLNRRSPEPCLLREYGALFTEAVMDPCMASDLLPPLWLLPNLQKLTVDYIDAKNCFRLHDFDGDSDLKELQEHWLKDEHDEGLVAWWKFHCSSLDADVPEWEKIMHEVPDDLPNFEVEAWWHSSRVMMGSWLP